MLNAIGLANPGIDAFEDNYLPRAAALPCAVIASVAGYSVEDYIAVAGTFDDLGVPNVARAYRPVSRRPLSPRPHHKPPPPPAIHHLLSTRSSSTSPARTSRRAATSAHLPRPFAKSSPKCVQGREAIQAHREALTLADGALRYRPGRDRRRGRCPDHCQHHAPRWRSTWRRASRALGEHHGRLSGPAIHPVAVRLVYDVYRQVAKPAGVPIIGAGGVLRWEDAAEFILAGEPRCRWARPSSPIQGRRWMW